MDEEKNTQETEETGKETPDGTEDDGVKPKSLKERKAEAEGERELLDLEAENKARRQLAGKAEAGGVKEKPKELSDVEYADKVMSGNDGKE